MVTVISFLLVLSLLVLVHEIGHFVVGRWAGARIEEFAIGLPPRVVSKRYGETDYSINALPLGGYVRFAGEDGHDVPGGLLSVPPPKRALILLAGVTMNALLAILLFSLVYATGYPTQVPIGGIRIAQVVAGSPADQAGLKAGDIVLKIADQTVNDTTAFSAAVRGSEGRPVALTVKHSDGQQGVLNVTPRLNPPQGEGPMGIAIELATVVRNISYSPAQALWKGLEQTWQATKMTFSIPAMIVQGLIPADLARPVGPLGISRIVGGAAEAIPVSGLAPILLTTALLSVSLAIVNILPFPGLDGGRLVFVLIEALRGGKRVDPQREAVIHFAGLMVLMGLFVIITYFDIVSPAPSINWTP